MDAPFDRIGEPHVVPSSPVVLSVPHAGRDYPAVLIAALRVPPTALLVLEDRYVDLVALAARTIQPMVVQRRPRAWIDLNRSEGERDAKIDEGARPQAQAAQSLKLRSGLGLIPRRAGAAGDLWRRRFSAAEVGVRIAQDHRPYHDALAAALAAARARFGIAVLIDVHSMPPLGGHTQVVLGDRFGRSAANRFVARLEAEATAAGMRCALNTPYAGGYILERHGAPAQGVHAMQVEVDRALYLDEALQSPGAGMADCAAMLRAMILAVEEEAMVAAGCDPLALAAE